MSESSGADFDLFDGGVYSPPGGHSRHRGAVRASDADREAAADELRRHHASGRLDTEELSDRLGQVYAARTHGSLDKLFVDLPPAGPPVIHPVRNQGPSRYRRRSFCLPVIVPLFILGGLLSDGHHGASTAFAAVLLAFVACSILLLCITVRLVRSGSRFFYEAGRNWAHHRSRW